MSIKPKGTTHFTAGHLAHALSILPPETPVYVRGYEGGVDYVTNLNPIKVKKFENTGTWYYGEHEEAPSYRPDEFDESGYEITGSHVEEAPDAP